MSTATSRLLERKAELPISVAGCEIRRSEVRAELRTFVILSRGPLGGQNVAVFEARGDTAHVYVISKYGRFGHSEPTMLIERHVQALRELEFTEFVLPSGKRYEIRDGLPGVRRLRE